MRSPLPYPLSRIRQITAGEAERRGRMARRLGLVGLAGAAESAGALLGARVTATPEPVGLCPVGLLDRVIPERCVALALASGADPARGRFVVEVEPAFARQLVDRLLGAEAAESEGPVEAPLGEIESGALLYFAARLASEASSGALRVVASLGSRSAVHAALGGAHDGRFAAPEGDLAFWPVRVEVGASRATVRVWVDDARLDPAPESRVPDALAALALDVRLSRGRARLRASELAALGAGDALVLDEALPAEELLASVAGSTRAAFRCRLEPEGSRVIVQEFVPGREAGARAGRDPRHDWNVALAPRDRTARGPGMSEKNTSDVGDAERGLALAGDVEVELTVDVARIRLRLAELARMRPGEVLGTAVEVGERVRVRAGELDVAEGELVDVEGKLGVLVTKIFPTSAAG